MDQYRVAKRNLSMMIDQKVNQWGLDLVDFAIISVLLFLFARFIYKNFNRFKQKRYYIGIKRAVVQSFLKLPFANKEINRKIEEERKGFIKDFRSKNPTELQEELNDEPLSWDQIDTKLQILNKPDAEIKKTGKNTGEYYTPDESDWEQQIVKRSGKYLYYNLLHVDHLVGMRQAESELINFFIKMMNGDEEATGTTTSGGTESILLSILAYRNYARDVKGITEPELIMPESIHSAFLKGCHYFGIKPVLVPLDKSTWVVNLNKLKNMTSSNTIAICVSAGNFPHGLVDPIEQVCVFAQSRDIPVHVDCCLGGYSMLFGKELGFDVPEHSFKLPAVHSISIDPHKYGMAPKGISLALFRNRQIKQASIFVQETWQGGVYGTATISGSKQTASCIGAWIATLKLGKQGLKQAVLEIHDGLFSILSGLKELQGVTIMGNPQLNTFAFYIKDRPYDILQLGEGMIRKGWSIAMLQFPSALHFSLTMANLKVAKEQFVIDVTEVHKSLEENPKLYEDSKNATIYCTKLKIPDSSILEKVIKTCIAEMSVA